MWTDGRYHLQAVKEMDTNWTLMKDGLPETPSQSDWLIQSLGSGQQVGVDPWLMGANTWSRLSDKLEAAGLVLVPVETNLVDIAWSHDTSHPQPDRPDNTVFPLELEFTGAGWQEKVLCALGSGEEKVVIKEYEDILYITSLFLR